MGDAGHMVSDATALAMAALAARIARRPPSMRHSYGLGRAEVVAALIYSLFMVAVVTLIAFAAFKRLREPVPVQGGMVIAIALTGLCINILVAWTLSRGERTFFLCVVLLFVLGVVFVSVVALVVVAVFFFLG